MDTKHVSEPITYDYRHIRDTLNLISDFENYLKETGWRVRGNGISEIVVFGRDGVLGMKVMSDGRIDCDKVGDLSELNFETINKHVRIGQFLLETKRIRLEKTLHWAIEVNRF